MSVILAQRVVSSKRSWGRPSLIIKDRRSIAFVILLVLLVGCGSWVLVEYPPGWVKQTDVDLRPPFEHGRGFEYRAQVPDSIESDEHVPGASPLAVLEDGRPLGPSHSLQHEVADTGRGAFSHRGRTLYLSTSDNSDPNTNGRRYTIRFPAGLPSTLYVVMLFVTYVIALFLVWKLLSLFSGRATSLLFCIVSVILAVLVMESVFWVLLQTKLSKFGPAVQKYYHYGLGESQSEFAPTQYPGMSSNYVEHHYLNYVLNPDAAYCGIKQFNAAYRIRRTEPIRPRQNVKWRALILGGSTTFGEGVPKEEGTWPYVLESMIRERYGGQCDVINCGVGGYTILENYIHYHTLLRSLQPDLVILYTGLNDVHARLYDEIASDYSNYRVPWRSSEGPLPRAHQTLKTSYFYRYYFLRAVVLRTMEQGIGGCVSKKGPRPTEWAAALKRNSVEVYRSHADALIHSLKSEGINLAVLPQYFVAVTDRDAIFSTGVKEHNAVNEQLALTHGLSFARIVTAPGTFQIEDTFDNCHFTEQGGKKMAEAVFSFLEQSNLLPR